jgi:hypothetical protein
MSAMLTPSPKVQFFTANGDPLVGGKLYTYAAGTTSPLATYTDATGNTTNANPVILDSRGEADVWLGPSRYKWVLYDPNDVLIWSVDGIGTSFAAQSTAIVATGGQTIVTVPEYGLGGYLLVTVNGIVQELSTDYAETNTTTITFTSGLTAGDRILTRML